MELAKCSYQYDINELFKIFMLDEKKKELMYYNQKHIRYYFLEKTPNNIIMCITECQKRKLHILSFYFDYKLFMYYGYHNKAYENLRSFINYAKELKYLPENVKYKINTCGGLKIIFNF